MHLAECLLPNTNNRDKLCRVDERVSSSRATLRSMQICITG